MNNSELKKIIKQEIKQIQETLPKLQQSSEPVALDQNSVGRVSRMEAMGAQAVSLQTLAAATHRLNLLQQVLERIDRDDFGLCSECEEKINHKRLLARPESNLCIKCAQESESK